MQFRKVVGVMGRECRTVAGAAMALLLAIAAGQAHGAMITWQAAQATTGMSDLIDGPAVFARNGSANARTVNGITFTSINLGSGYLENVYGASAMTSTGDLAFDAMIRSFTYGGGPGNITLDITGLTAGKQYAVQVFYNDQRVNESVRTMIFDSDTNAGNGNHVAVKAGVAGYQPDDYGQHAIGTFTADGATQALVLRPDGFGNSHLNAVLVAEVIAIPSPAAITSGGALLLGLAAGRRRRR